MNPRFHKSGITLVEVLITCAVTTLSVLSLFAGFSVARKVVRSNTEALKADNVAFDILWKQFHQDGEYKDEELSSTNPKTFPAGVRQPARDIYRSSKLSDLPNYTYKIDHLRPTNGIVSITVSVFDGSTREMVRSLEVLRSSIPRKDSSLKLPTGTSN